MAIDIVMTNSKTNELKSIKVGFSWVLFLFSGIFGIPLFLRKLNVWGGIFAGLWIVNLVITSLATDTDVVMTVGILFQIIVLSLSIFIGIKGNEMTVKNYLEQDWEFKTPDSDEVKIAKGKWGLL
jgi:TctA family transporter